MPIILSFLFEIHLMLHPILFKNLIKSWISGSIAQFDNVVVPLARHEAIIKFSVAPTDTLEKCILEPTRPSGADAIT